MRTAYGKWKGVLCFFLRGGASLSEEKKACCTMLAGSEGSQHRFACCHSQSKMPPLPGSQSATLLFRVPDVYPSQGYEHVCLAMLSHEVLEGHLPTPWKDKCKEKLLLDKMDCMPHTASKFKLVAWVNPGEPLVSEVV